MSKGINDYLKFTLGERITPEQREFFSEFGFIHFKSFISPDTVASFIRASQEVEKAWATKNIEKVNGVPIKYGVDLDGSSIVQRFAFINKHHLVFSEFLQDPRFELLLDLVGIGARLGIDEKDGMVFNHYINSPYSKFTRMGWHVDGLRDIFYGQKLNQMLNVGIHLSSIDPARQGGLRIIPGSHQQGLYDLLFRKFHFLDHRPDENELALTPQPGDLTIHDGRLWHRVAKSSVAGEESRRRVIYIPIITGAYAPKNESSPTLLYQRFSGIVN